MVQAVGVELENVSVRFGDFVAVRDAKVSIEGGEFFSFLGPPAAARPRSCEPSRDFSSRPRAGC